MANSTETSPTAPVPRRRRTSPGMSRRTYYMSQDAADSLDSAVDQLYAATSGLIPRHTIIGAIINRGLTHLEDIHKDLIESVKELLTPHPPEPSNPEGVAAIVAAIRQHAPADVAHIRELLAEN